MNPEYVYSQPRFLSCAVDNPPDLHRQCVEEIRDYQYGELTRVFKCPCPCHQLEDNGQPPEMA